MVFISLIELSEVQYFLSDILLQVQRVTYRRRHCYATSSNEIKKVRTPGGKLAVQYVKKLATQAKCGDCDQKLPGIAALRPNALKNAHKRQRTVARAYGGSQCSKCVRQRIVRAFLIEEQKIVKEVLRTKKTATAKTA